MKRMILIAITTLIIISLNSDAQETITISSTGAKPVLINTPAPRVVINFDMIERFKSVETSDGYYSWSEIISTFSRQSLKDLYFAYLNADFTTENLKDIKLALEKNLNDTQQQAVEYTQDEIAWLNNVKKKINQKLTAQLMVAN